jgi:hypothetical protein
MLKNFGISALLFGLLLASIDGFRAHDRAHTGSPSAGTIGTGSTDDVHMAEGGAGVFPPK